MTGRDFGELLLTVWWMFVCGTAGGLLGGGLAVLVVLGATRVIDWGKTKRRQH